MNHRILCAGLLALAVACPAGAANLTLLPDWFDAPTVRNLFMMPDGRTFTGIDGTDVFRWSMSSGRTNIGTFPLTIESIPVRSTAISDDGNTIIGYLGDNQFQPLGGFVWTAAGGAVVMPSSADGTNIRAVPTALSSNGRVIVGNEYQPTDPWGYQVDVKGGFRWTAETGTVPLDGLNGLKFPAAISGDGSVVVGGGPLGVVRWTEANGAVGLGVPPDGWQPTISVNFVSTDGAAIVGHGSPPDALTGPKAFLWTAQTGFEQLSTRGDDQWAQAISSDANVVIGLMRTLDRDAPGFAVIGEQFVWTPETGLQTLYEFLVRLGVDQLDPLNDAHKYPDLFDVSANGRVFFGASIEYEYKDDPYIPIFHYDYWLLDVSPAPEPATLSLACLCLGPMALVRRRGSPRRYPCHLAHFSIEGGQK